MSKTIAISLAGLAMFAGLVLVNSVKETRAQTAPGCQALEIGCPVQGGCQSTSDFAPGGRPVPGTTQIKPHWGIDYVASRRTPILAAADGFVERAYDSKTFGKTVVLRHRNADRSATVYAHLDQILVSTGDVFRGQTIGLSNNTGKSRGDHLHFELIQGGQALASNTVSPRRVDPKSCIGLPSLEGTYAVSYKERVLTNPALCEPEDLQLDVAVRKDATGKFVLDVTRYSIPLTQNENGSLSGQGTATYPDDDGQSTTTVDVSISTDGKLSGTATWSYTDSSGTCTGDGTFTGTKKSSPAPTVPLP